jgi:alanyl-tRNA synthetase
MKADILREKFLEFFRSKEHKIVESDSLVPKDDPTVLFTPAGMNQFKKQFLGLITDFRRAASSQRCLRTDDLEKVGKTDCHHTFFEMLGNFSFGDYFKEEAISWAWEFLTQELKISSEKLWVSVYKDDQEAFNIWKDKIKIPAEKISKLGDKENFWPQEAKEKGPNGPCGPCSEIFFDLGHTVGCKKPECSPACSCGRFVEVWNLVFTQFNRKEGGILEPLPQKNIDTGMGLERLAAVMQGASNNFQTDLFQPLIKEIVSSAKQNKGNNADIYATSDHIRAVVFSIFDGVLPSNEARGYVVRKLIRKCILHLRTLGIKEPFLYKLVPLLAEVMKKPYPELLKRRENIAEVILAEEKNFIATLDSSDSILEEKLKAPVEPEKAGIIAFQLYDTYGIPLELTMSWAKRKKIEISREVFERELNTQKSRSKSQSAMQGDVFSFKELHLKDIPETVFLGYNQFMSEARIIRIIKDDKETESASAGEEAKIILDQTTMYAESGGQVADTGEIEGGYNVFEVIDTQNLNKIFLHSGKVKQGAFKKGDIVLVRVYSQRRLAIARNHTATHLLQAALRKVLGQHIQQQGSLVAEDRLRFDFTHFRDIKKEELDRIEEVVNEYIISNYPLQKQEMSLAQAKNEGALAFFAEKYEDNVRVVSVGEISKELCGGTHLNSTGSIGLFKIMHESSVASGVRRIEASTGNNAYKRVKEEEDILNRLSEVLKTPADKLTQELEKRLKLIKDLEKRVSSMKLNNVTSSIDDLIKKATVEGKGIKVITQKIADADLDTLRKTADMLKQKESNLVIALGSDNAGQAFLITATNYAGIDSSALIKQIAIEIGGSGGGRKDFAQAGGNKPENIQKALDKFKKIVIELLS